MSICEEQLGQYNKYWQERIVKINFITSAVILVFEIVYYFMLTALDLRVQAPLEYILAYILLPASIIFSFCTVAWFIVYRSKLTSITKSLAAILTMVAICTTGATAHNIFAAALCSFFIPLTFSIVFGERRITNITGGLCVVGELLAMYFASMDLRGMSPYFLLECLMLFIVFGIAWYTTLSLMKNEQVKRHAIEHMSQLEREISHSIQGQEELRLRLEQHQIIMDQTTDTLFEWDIRKDTLNFSANWHKKFGYEPIGSKISGRIPLSSNIHPDDMHAFVKIMNDTAAGIPYSEAEFRIKDGKARYHWCRIRATTQFDDCGRAVKAVGVILDISDEKQEKDNLLKMAQRDALTGIYNKAATNARIARYMETCDANVLQALLIIDVDYFKSVNDTYGHIAGDNLLSAVAAELRGSHSLGDVVGRVGGDEFLVYLSSVESEAEAIKKAQTIHAALGRLTPVHGAPPITSSIGVAVCPHGTAEYVDLYRYADVALYIRKDKGRNGVSVYDSSCSQGADVAYGATI